MRILDGPLVDGELSDDVRFDARIEVAGWSLPSIADGKRCGIGVVAVEELKELRLAETQHGSDIGALNFMLQIPLQHVPYLVVRKSLMQLSHLLEPSLLGSRIRPEEEFTFKT